MAHTVPGTHAGAQSLLENVFAEADSQPLRPAEALGWYAPHQAGDPRHLTGPVVAMVRNSQYILLALLGSEKASSPSLNLCCVTASTKRDRIHLCPATVSETLFPPTDAGV